jgi:hypothetical protein
MTEPQEQENATPREGDPLHDLWHWSQHPLARTGIIVAILLAILVAFPLLAQVVF